MKKNSSPDCLRLLKAALAARGLREADVAQALGISTASVSRIIHGQRRARAEERRKLEVLLGYRVAQLLRRRGRRARSWPSRSRR